MSIRNVAFAGAAALLAAGPLAACNEVPVASLEKSFTMKVNITEGDPKPVKIDFLWVVDNSTSMCEEQVALTKSFQTFTTELNRAFDVDAHVAVTTADAQCDPNVTKSSARGVFNRTPADGFPPSCFAKDPHPCLQDVDCNTGEETTWTCDGGAQGMAVCVENPNGSLNSACTYRCGADVPAKPSEGAPADEIAAYEAALAAADQECRDQFSKGELNDWYCHRPSGTKKDWGCMLPPQTKQCPTDLPSILRTEEELKHFSCVATVGVIQDKCFKYEQGLNTALWAIDPNGPNPDQAREFLRDDAYLVIIFVTDEDDCSVPENRSVHEDFYDTCGVASAKAYLEANGQAVTLDNPDLLKEGATVDAGGKLHPVSYFINKYKGLKKDPSKVIVAAIAGDSTIEERDANKKIIPEKLAQKMAERAAYVASKGDKRTCHKQSSICNSDVGKSDWGSRYLALTEGFGPNGVFTNICNDAGIGQALEDIANQVVSVVNKICLPHPVKDSSKLLVTRTTDRIDDTMKTIVMVEGGEEYYGYDIVDGGEECKVNGFARPALQFKKAPTNNEQIAIEYEAAPFQRL